jgi:KaiC/GvpD/RAD55 family RecA-like ATPase
VTPEVSTGIADLDDLLGGGVPAGSLVLLTAEPTSHAPRLLRRLAEARNGRYVAVEPLKSMVEDAFERDGRGELPPIDGVDGDESIEEFGSVLSGLGDRTTLVVDGVGPLERAGDQYRSLLSFVRERTGAAGGVAYLYGVEGRAVPPKRDLTERAADVVLRLRTTVDTDGFETQLDVETFRERPGRRRTVELTLGSTVRVDVSRDIA